MQGTAGPLYMDYWASADAASFAYKPHEIVKSALAEALLRQAAEMRDALKAG
jgi:hypothetical protein